ncbi:hypothetical protein TSUD_37040 [Trifolium subterraneum]|uniref:Fucosyltransferase n=1 Tax=Trifolium subterraneum TaxID=3900 RepID=A0A2Z6ML52_TRISU|nr:hypothetical protein TSUD_37040 [Trifolium subterraneum]
MVKLKRFKSNKSDTTGSCKYIVWTAANGLGNRMVSMASIFLYAILTDRVLLVEFRDDMVGLFCEPFPNSSWILPKDFPFSDNRKVEIYESMLKKDKENTSKKLLLPSTIGVRLNMYQHEHEFFFSCDHNQHLLHKVPLLIITSDQYFVPALFMVPSFNQELNKMFPNKDTVFHHLGRYLFLPSNDVWGPIKRFYRAYLARADEKIGIQIRVFHPNLTRYETIMGQSLGGINPLVLKKLRDNDIPDSPCMQDFSMEPCFHITPKLDCMEKPIDHMGTMFPYMKKCVDYKRGVKLVNDIL